MSLLHDEDAAFLKESFSALAQDVTLTAVIRTPSMLITADQPEPDASGEVKQICEEVAATSERIKIGIVDAGSDPERAEALTAGHLPAIVMTSASTKGKIRYYGLPAGYEMSALIATIMDLGRPADDVPEEVSQRLGALAGDVHIQVFVTPS